MNDMPRPSTLTPTVEPALFLTDAVDGLNQGANFLARLSPDAWETLRRKGTTSTFDAGGSVFIQGDRHEGIWLIEEGIVRTFYTAPSGREITLAYWTAGHFVGGPEIFGGGEHIWSADVTRGCRLLYLPGGTIRDLITTLPSFAICLIEGLVAKGKCYSALAQMLGTRSVVERLAHLLVILAENHGHRDGNRLVIDRKITHDQIATIVGSTRQWVTITLDKFQKQGIIAVARQSIVVERYDLLMAQTNSD
jgi:CRP/FNR family transcriptional regulator, cyclic AMP receptor protein